jgi:hypothetical protein
MFLLELLDDSLEYKQQLPIHRDKRRISNFRVHIKFPEPLSGCEVIPSSDLLFPWSKHGEFRARHFLSYV